LPRSNDAHQKVEEVLSKYSESPDGEPKLKGLLPAITSCFGSNKSVLDTLEALKKELQSSDPGVVEWAKGALEGFSKGAPFSLFVTQMHYSQVAAAVSETSNPLSKVINHMSSGLGYLVWHV
jgi:3-hydroxyisobutyryl-CoA hydrolase